MLKPRGIPRLRFRKQSRACGKQTAKTPHRTITLLKLDAANQRLISKGGSVNQVAMRSAFSWSVTSRVSLSGGKWLRIRSKKCAPRTRVPLLR
jgi:hypothetical protein